MAVLARTAWHAVGASSAPYYLWINKSYSEGEITLRSTDPTQSPLIDFRLLSDRRDHERMKIAFRTIADLALASLSSTAVRHEVFPTIFLGSRALSLGTDRRGTRSRQRCLRKSSIPGLHAVSSSRPSLRRPISRNCSPTHAMLDQFLHDAIVGVWHACGSCRMGAEG